MPQSMPGGRQMEPPMVESMGEQSSKEEKSYKSKGTNNIDENIALKGIIVDEDEIRRRRKSQRRREEEEIKLSGLEVVCALFQIQISLTPEVAISTHFPYSGYSTTDVAASGPLKTKTKST